MCWRSFKKWRKEPNRRDLGQARRDLQASADTARQLGEWLTTGGAAARRMAAAGPGAAEQPGIKEPR
jgi:hypothetical protein